MSASISKELPKIKSTVELRAACRAHWKKEPLADLRISEAHYQQGDWFLRSGRKKLAKVDPRAVRDAPFVYLYCRILYVVSEGEGT
jgi:hypothetical protein